MPYKWFQSTEEEKGKLPLIMPTYTTQEIITGGKTQKNIQKLYKY